MEPISIYDKPGILLSQIFGDELTLDGLKNLAMQPEALTPEERKTIAQRLTGESEVPTVVETAIGVATNPFVWLYFLTSAPGGMFAKKGVGLFTETSTQAMKRLHQKSPSLLQSLHMLTSNHVGSNTITGAAKQFERGQEAFLEEIQQRYLRDEAGDDIVDLFNDRHGFYHGLNYDAGYTKGGREYLATRRIEAAMAARAEGMHRLQKETVVGSRTKAVYYSNQVDEDGVVQNVRRELKESEVPAAKEEIAKRREKYHELQKEYASERYDVMRMKGAARKQGFKRLKEMRAEMEKFRPGEVVTPATLEVIERGDKAPILSEKKLLEVFDEYEGLEDVFWRGQEAKHEARIKMIGREDLDEWFEFQDERGVTRRWRKLEVDDGKVEKIRRSLQSEIFNESMIMDDPTRQGRALMAQILGPEQMAAIAKGESSVELTHDALKQALGHNANNPWYNPRNIQRAYEVKDESGRVILGKPNVDQLRNTDTYGMGVSPSVVPRTEERLAGTIYAREDLDVLNEFVDEGTRKEFDLFVEANESKIRMKVDNDTPFSVTELRGPQATDKYLTDVGNTHAMHIQELEDGVINVANEAVGRVREHFVPAGGAASSRRMLKEETIKEIGEDGTLVDGVKRSYARTRLRDVEFKRGSTVADAISFSVQAELDPYSAKSFASTFIPMLVHRTPPDVKHLVSNGMFYEGKRAVGALAKTRPIKMLEESGEWGRRFVEKMNHYADPETKMKGGVGMSGALAKYLYVTHLGLNLGSIALNMTQPFLLAGTAMGWRNLAKGYVRAVKEMGSYFQDRWRTYGASRITREQRDELIDRNFKWSNETGIKATTDEILDKLELSGRGKRNQTMEYWTVEMPLKMFEKSEWLNRNVAAHAVEVSMEGTQFAPSAFRIANNVERFVEETQFGMTVHNTPELFLNNRVFNNPLMRQFLGFNLRSFTGLVHALPRMAGGVREVPVYSPLRLLGIKEVSGTLPVLGADVLRGMGMSAMIYELGKGMLGADLSRGLFFEASTGVLGVGSFTNTQEDVLPIPPVLDIPIDFIRGFANDDVMQMKLTASRMFPAGVAFTRLLGAAPDLPDWLGPLNLQRRSIGWDEPLEDGSVPMYDWDGSLIKYAQPSEVIMNALGVDLGRFERSGGLDAFLVKNRDRIVSMRREYIKAVERNDMKEAEQIEAMFMKQFGYPLTVTQQQIESYRALTTVPRTERILDRMDKGAREQYKRAVLLNPSQTLPVDLTEGATAAERRRNDDNPRLTDAQASEQDGGRQQFPGFTSFESF